MGLFSWKTIDTDRSIPSSYSSRKPFRVIMTDDKGNQWVEDDYEGYGVFGGKDYYELLDEMNGGTGDREVGIDREYQPNKYPNTIFPSLSECGKYYDGVQPETCEYQGYFYYDDNEFEDEDDDDMWSEEDDIDPAGGHGPGSHI
jgi:hypothetical protein